MNTLDQLLTFPRFGETGVNERMEELCRSLSSTPWWQNEPCLKVVGSNGKGTTATMMSTMAQNLGKKVGLYTSPHLLRVSERIQINGVEISQVDFEGALSWAIDQSQPLSGAGRFEILTLACLYHFCEHDVDVAIMEVGLGGRFDPVRIAPGNISILTSIDLEHTQILGDSLSLITQEKAAICKKGDLLISGVTDVSTALPDGVSVLYKTTPDPMQNNLLLAQAALFQHFKLSQPPKLTSPLHMPARMQCLSKDPLIYLDVAHSPSAVQTILPVLQGKKVSLICGARHDKDIQAMAEILSPHVNHVIAFNPEDNMMAASDILDAFRHVKKDKALTAAHAFELAKANLKEGEIILCLGGFAVASHILAYFEGMATTDFIRI